MKKYLLSITGWLFVSYSCLMLCLCLATFLVPDFFKYLATTPSLFFNSESYTNIFHGLKWLVVILISIKFLVLFAVGIIILCFSKKTTHFQKLGVWLIVFVWVCALLGQLLLSFWLLFLSFILSYYYTKQKVL